MDWVSKLALSLLSWLPPVASMAAGWALNELTQLIQIRREDRRAAGPVLTDLLEIRHQLIALDAFMKELGQQIQIPAQIQIQLKQYIRTHFPEPPRFVERYEEAVSTLARVDPIQAFRLRSQPLINPFLAHLRGLVASDEAASQLWTTVVEPEFLRLVKPHLEELIIDVAKAHGWHTWWRACRQLRKQIPSERDRAAFAEYMSKLKSAAGAPPGG